MTGRGLALMLVFFAFHGAAWAQAPKTYEPPRLADGHPDLQGVWTRRWITPLERPNDVSQLVVPADEAAKIFQRVIAQSIGADPLNPARPDPDAGSLAVVRGEYRSSLIVDPEDGKLPMTEQGRRRLARGMQAGVDNPEERFLTERCLGGIGRAPLQLNPEGTLLEIVQPPGQFMMHSEYFDELREYRLGAPRGRVATPGWKGEGIAWWEGDALIVETTSFRPDDYRRGGVYGNFPIAQNTKVTERFLRVSENEIVYSYTVDDPELYTRPWTAELSLTHSSDRLYESACHEGNHSMTNILQGGRAQDQRKRGRVAVVDVT